MTLPSDILLLPLLTSTSPGARSEDCRVSSAPSPPPPMPFPLWAAALKGLARLRELFDRLKRIETLTEPLDVRPSTCPRSSQERRSAPSPALVSANEDEDSAPPSPLDESPPPALLLFFEPELDAVKLPPVILAFTFRLFSCVLAAVRRRARMSFKHIHKAQWSPEHQPIQQLHDVSPQSTRVAHGQSSLSQISPSCPMRASRASTQASIKRRDDHGREALALVLSRQFRQAARNFPRLIIPTSSGAFVSGDGSSTSTSAGSN